MDQPEHKGSTQNHLLVLTASLLFYYYSEAKVDGFTLLGTTIRFGNANALVEFAWVVWGYYYLRSYQYYKEIGETSYTESLQALFIHDFVKRMNDHQKDALRVFREREGARPLQVRITPTYRGPFMHSGNSSQGFIERILRSPLSLLQRLLRGRRSRGNDGELSLNLMRENRFRRARRWLLAPGLPTKLRLIIYPEHNLQYLDGGERIEIPIPWFRVYRVAIVHLKSIATRPAFWENYGPLVLGLLPAWYVIFLNWHHIVALLA